MAHRRFGKDFIALLVFVISALKYKGNYYIFAPYFRQAKEIIVDGKTLEGLPLVETLIPREILKNPKAPNIFNKSDWSCELFNGSKIFIRGADNPDSNVGVGARGIIYTEAALMRPNFYQLMKPAIDMVIEKTGFGVVIFISTPRGKNNWFTKLFIDYFTKYKNNRRLRAKWYLDVQTAFNSRDYKGKPILSEEYLEEQRLQMTPENFAQEYGCDPNLTLAGSWFGKEIDKAYEDKRIGCYGEFEEIIDRGKYYKEYTGYFWTYNPLYVSWDIGRRDHTVVWLYQVNPNNGRIRYIWHYRVQGVGPDHVVDKVRKYCKKKHIYGHRLNILPHDGDNHEWTAATKRSDYIRGLGENVVTLSKTDLAESNMIRLITQINTIRENFNLIEIDESECNLGVMKLKEYVRKYNRSLGEYIDVVDHDANDKASDDADAFRTGFIYYIKHLKNTTNVDFGAVTTQGEAVTYNDNDYLYNL